MLRAKYKFRSCVYTMPKFSSYSQSNVWKRICWMGSAQHGYISKGKVEHDYNHGADTLYYYTIYDLLLFYYLYR